MTNRPESLPTQLLASLPIGIIVWHLDDPADDTSLRLVFANAPAGAMLHQALDAEVGRRILDVFPKASPERIRAYAEVCRTRTAQRVGEILDGDALAGGTALAVAAIPVLEHDVAVVIENLSDQRRAEAEVRRVNRFLDSIIEQLPAMIFVKDADTLKFERFNRAGEELLGLQREQLIGKSDHDFFPPEQADFFVSKDRQVLANRTLEDIAEEPIDTPAGTRWLHTRKIPILDDGGKPRYLLGVSIDITERKRAEEMLRDTHRTELEHHIDERERAQRALAHTEEQLRQSQRLEAIGLLAGGVAHDFNNILGVVVGYTSSALARMRPGDPMREELEEIRRAGDRAVDLTRQLLAFSRQQVMQPRIIDLNLVVRGMERLLPRLIGEDIDLVIRTCDDARPVMADPGQLEQVLMNLVVNARDAMPTGGKLTIETANIDFDEAYSAEHLGLQPGPHAMLAVTDSGKGMDRETLSRVFEPFFTTKEQGRGTGLGLSTAFGIVKQSGGSIWTYSEPGRGATFKVYLPICEEHPAPPAPPAPEPADLMGKETVLLVEDDHQLRRLTATILERYGYRVIACDGPEEARAQANNGPIDILVTDVVMPEMSGRQLAEVLVQRMPNLRVLFMSGYTDDAIVRHGIIDSRLSFLQKPFTPAGLAKKVREVLETPVHDEA